MPGATMAPGVAPGPGEGENGRVTLMTQPNLRGGRTQSAAPLTAPLLGVLR